LAEFNNSIEQSRLRLRRAACRDATLTELALDHWKSVVTAVGGQLFSQMALNRDSRKSTNASRVLGECLGSRVSPTRSSYFIAIGIVRKASSVITRRNPHADLVDKMLGHVGGKDDSGPDNGSSNAADGYGVFQLRGMQRVIELIRAPSPGVIQAEHFAHVCLPS